jgi:Cys-Gly metallodipeptidase DUG1
MGHWLADQIKALGGTVELRELGKQPDRQHLDLPPCLLGRLGDDPKKPNVLLYGHYDVQPAQKSDGWATDPFTLTIDDKGRMYGRGSTDDKGPVLGWLNAIEAHQAAGMDLPVNLLMCFEGMEENGSEGLDDTIRAEAKKFFKETDVVCISDNYWLGTEKPCLTYGVRGCNYYSVEIGKILIDGIADLVAPMTEQELALYPPIAFTMDDLKESLGGEVAIHGTKEEALQHKMRYPSLSLHGIEGAFYSEGAKTVIPARVVGKFSIRTVPNMEIDEVTKLVEKHVNAEWAKLKSKNKFTFNVLHCGKWWVEDFNHPNYTAAAKAVERVFGVKPDMTREGGSIPVTLTFQEELGKNVLLLPMGSSTDAAHSINEKLDKRNYIEGTKLLGAYLHYVAGELKRNQ